MGLEDWEQRLGRWAVRASAEQVTLPAPADCLESIEQSAMACEFEVLLNQGQYPQGIEQARDALRVVHALEDQLSVYRSTSDFSTINRFGHLRAVAARVDVCQLLVLASQVSEQTGGAFDITAGALSEAWGFSRRQGRKPNDDELADVLSKVGAHLVEVDQAARTVRLHREGVKLNPGGIGKGYALDRVASSLVEGGLQDFLVHGGRSSVLASGSRWDSDNVQAVLANRRARAKAQPQQHQPHAQPEDQPHAHPKDQPELQPGWWIALAHPLRWEEKLGKVRLCNQALGTSGAGKQFFHYQGVRYSHVIDPRTGWPAQGVLSATAICRSGALADALATAFMVMGVAATGEFCRIHPHFSAILVSQVEGSSRLAIDCINVAEDAWRPKSVNA